jgi:hypothetical protein
MCRLFLIPEVYSHMDDSYQFNKGGSYVWNNCTIPRKERC